MAAELARKTLTVTEAAHYLGLSRNSAYQAVRQGDLPAIRVGRRLLIPIHALESLLAGSQPLTTHN